jgi:hypothetical protein
LKMERVARCFSFVSCRLVVAAHPVSPGLASKWHSLLWRIGFSYGAIVARKISQDA